MVGILERMGLLDSTNVPRPLPWRHIPVSQARSSESVRPIYWSNRPKAYIKRTADWDAFPSGRWAAAGGEQQLVCRGLLPLPWRAAWRNAVHAAYLLC